MRSGRGGGRGNGGKGGGQGYEDEEVDGEVDEEVDEEAGEKANQRGWCAGGVRSLGSNVEQQRPLAQSDHPRHQKGHTGMIQPCHHPHHPIFSSFLILFVAHHD